MVHGDAHGPVAGGDGGGGQAVAFRAQYEGQLVGCLQARIGDGKRVVGQGQGGCGKAGVAQARHALARPIARAADAGPGHLEHRTHGNARRAAKQRVMAGRREQHRIDAEGGGAAEDGPDVGVVRDVLQHGDAVGASKQGGQVGLGRPVKGGQGPAGHLVAGDGAHLLRGDHGHGGGRIGRVHLFQEHFGGGEPARIGEHGEGDAPGVKGAVDDVHGLSDEQARRQALRRALRVDGAGQAHELLGVAQLPVGHRRERRQIRVAPRQERCLRLVHGP